MSPTPASPTFAATPIPPPVGGGAPPGGPPAGPPFQSALEAEWARTATAEGHQQDSPEKDAPESPARADSRTTRATSLPRPRPRHHAGPTSASHKISVVGASSVAGPDLASPAAGIGTTAQLAGSSPATELSPAANSGSHVTAGKTLVTGSLGTLPALSSPNTAPLTPANTSGGADAATSALADAPAGPAAPQDTSTAGAPETGVAASGLLRAEALTATHPGGSSAADRSTPTGSAIAGGASTSGASASGALARGASASGGPAASSPADGRTSADSASASGGPAPGRGSASGGSSLGLEGGPSSLGLDAGPASLGPNGTPAAGALPTGASAGGTATGATGSTLAAAHPAPTSSTPGPPTAGQALPGASGGPGGGASSTGSTTGAPAAGGLPAALSGTASTHIGEISPHHPGALPAGSSTGSTAGFTALAAGASLEAGTGGTGRRGWSGLAGERQFGSRGTSSLAGAPRIPDAGHNTLWVPDAASTSALGVTDPGASVGAGTGGNALGLAGAGAFGQASAALAGDPQASLANLPSVGYGVGLQQAIEDLHGTIQLAARQGLTQARIALEPEELGEIRIHLTQTADGLIARLTAETSTVAQALASGHAHLRQSLSSLGLHLARLDIGHHEHSTQDGGMPAGEGGQEEADARGGLHSHAVPAPRQSTPVEAAGGSELDPPVEAPTSLSPTLADGTLVNVLV
jgi:hypothetical protein